MTHIILDFGSGNTCLNKEKEAIRMIDELAKVDTGKHQITIKYQLWSPDNKQGDNKRLDFLLFHAMAEYAFDKYGYKTTASVFDLKALRFLCELPLSYELPFIKIACNPSLYWLAGEVPRKIPVIVSVNTHYEYIGMGKDNQKPMFCVSKYPASLYEYLAGNKNDNISDHTKSLELFKKSNPEIIEMHYALEGQKGADVECGICKTPEMLKEIL